MDLDKGSSIIIIKLLPWLVFGGSPSLQQQHLYFELNTAFISKYQISEVVIKFFPGKLQPLLVHCTYELVIRAASEGPPQCSPTMKNSSKVKAIAQRDE